MQPAGAYGRHAGQAIADFPGHNGIGSAVGSLLAELKFCPQNGTSQPGIGNKQE